MDKTFRKRIRAAYAKVREQLEAGERLCPYSLGIDWWGKFSPIEDNVWHDIRVHCLPLYPQYPIAGYFVDFAQPKRKIAIEVDGRQWHRDKDADRKRQAEIESLGWRVIRIPGWTTYKKLYDYVDPDTMQGDWEGFKENTSEWFLWDMFQEFPESENARQGGKPCNTTS